MQHSPAKSSGWTTTSKAFLNQRRELLGFMTLSSALKRLSAGKGNRYSPMGAKCRGLAKKAANVNSLDEVPDSSWYTNRHALRHMTIEQLVRGPNRGGAPGPDPRHNHQGEDSKG